MTTFDAAPGESAPGAQPVGKFALRHLVQVPVWEDLQSRQAVLDHLERSLALDAFRQGYGLLERPERQVREMVWDPRSGSGYRETLPFERPDVFDVCLTVKVVDLDG